MIASEYQTLCSYRKQCDASKCSPWGFTHDRTPEANGKRILLVGLNSNDSELDIGDPSRDEYSKYLKGLIYKEIESRAYKCLSNIIPPLARFIYGATDADVDLQVETLKHLNWCNVISCCPPPTSRSKPTRTMKLNCIKRLTDHNAPHHEIVCRIEAIKPTHILVLGNDAKSVWLQSSGTGTALAEIPIDESSVFFCKHPSQTSITRAAYWVEVNQVLSGHTKKGTPNQAL